MRGSLLLQLGALLFLVLGGHSASAGASGSSAAGRQLKAFPNAGYKYIRHGLDWPGLQDADGNAEYPACSGQNQSPINIDMGMLTESSLRSDTSGVSLNGLNVDGTNDGGITLTGATITLEQALRVDFTKPTNNLPTITIDGSSKKFVPYQFHFHHFLSEHTINGVHFPLELHVVMHEEGQDPSDGSTQLAVIGIMYKYTNDAAGDTFLQSLKTQIEAKVPPADPATAQYGQSGVPIEDINFKNDLLPSSLEYVGYDGSLTTPGCDERVKWHVFTTPRSISIQQIEFFKEVTMKAHPEDAALVNNRVIQDLNGRKVYKYGV